MSHEIMKLYSSTSVYPYLRQFAKIFLQSSAVTEIVTRKCFWCVNLIRHFCRWIFWHWWYVENVLVIGILLFYITWFALDVNVLSRPSNFFWVNIMCKNNNILDIFVPLLWKSLAYCWWANLQFTIYVAPLVCHPPRSEEKNSKFVASSKKNHFVNYLITYRQSDRPILGKPHSQCWHCFSCWEEKHIVMFYNWLAILKIRYRLIQKV